MTNQPPTSKSEDELREKLYSIFELDCDYYNPEKDKGCGYDGYFCNRHTRYLNDAINLLSTHQHEAEIRARIDELKMLDTVGFMSTGKDFIYEIRQSDIDNRIAELEAQLREIKGTDNE